MADYRKILQEELVRALGCTEPIAIALCAAKARELLGQQPERIEVACSGNVIKNAKSVTVPQSGGMAGIQAAAALGCCGGAADRELEVLLPVTEEHRQQARSMLAEGRVRVRHERGVDTLYIRVCMSAGEQCSEAVISGAHSHFVRLCRNGEALMEEAATPDLQDVPQEEMRLVDILPFVGTIDFEQDPAMAELFDMQRDCNLAIAQEGLNNDYGAAVGKTLLEMYPDDARTRLRAFAAAGSDARMAGSPMPVVINSGSGNQGMTSSLPLVVYAMDNGVQQEELYRALALSNLLAVYIKRLMGKLSAFCGVVSAAAAAGAGLAYLQGFTQPQMAEVMAITLLTSGGILCDGAKASCASKIAVALDNALLAIEMVRRGRSLPEGQGLKGETPDDTIRRVARIAKQGMKETDEEIIDVMIGGASD